MFTCIIPTLWRSQRIFRLIKDLCSCDRVGEVLVIDNDINNPRIVDAHHKLHILAQDKNLYVNPSWNFGVKLAKYDEIALINDDINFNTEVFQIFRYDGALSQKIVGVSPTSYSLPSDSKWFTMHECQRGYGWGCLMFIHRINYIPIPKDLLIWCGDDWLTMNLPTYEIQGLKIETEMSTTTNDSSFLAIKYKDTETFYKKYKRIPITYVGSQAVPA